MTTLLKDATASAITTAVSTTLKGDRAKANAVDLLVADGFKATDFISPKGKDSKSTASPELFEQINSKFISSPISSYINFAKSIYIFCFNSILD